jgi:phosphate transport system substrate-binding protein
LIWRAQHHGAQNTASGTSQASDTNKIRPPPAGPTPDLTRDVVLAGSNTIGGHLAGPLLAAFAAADGATGAKVEGWTAPDAWRQTGDDKFTTDKLKKCRLNAHPEDQLQVTGGRTQLVAIGLGSGCAAPLLDAGLANVGMASRPINQDEKTQYASLGPWTDEGAPIGTPPRREHVIAMDGVVIIANAAVKPQSLTKDQIRRLFQRDGDAVSWKAVGGPDVPVRVMSRETVSGTYDTFKDLVLGGKDLVFDPSGANGAREFSDTAALLQAVQSTPGAIGYVGLQYAAEHPELVVPISECRLQYSPVGEGADWMIKTEDYPLARRLFLYTPETLRDRSQKALAFIDFVKSPLGQKAVQKAGYVSLEIVPVTAGAAGELRRTAADLQPLDFALAQKYRTLTRNAVQLTATIRFGFNEAELDARARDDVQRVVDFMKQPANANATLIVAGFADRVGAADANDRKAADRAAAVAAAFREAGAGRVQSVGFGAEAPVGCNDKDDEVGRRKNRRVELWLAREGQNPLAGADSGELRRETPPHRAASHPKLSSRSRMRKSWDVS